MNSATIEIPGYQIVRELGRGGMATVYLAIQQSFGREVALKVMSPMLSSDPGFSERFQREARIVSQLIHPHIVTVYDVGEHMGYNYLSMEYIRGDDLRHKRHKLPFRERLRIVREIADALDYASKKGYVHRDVKPENIMLYDEGDRAVLMDFGIARTTDGDSSMTRTGTVIGTPHYLSPEQAQGKDIDSRSDIYSLGVVLFQLLADRVPYHADSSLAVVYKHIHEPIPKLPRKMLVFQPVIDKALTKDREQRFQTGADLVAALDAMMQKIAAAARIRKKQRAAGITVTQDTIELPEMQAQPPQTGATKETQQKTGNIPYLDPKAQVDQTGITQRKSRALPLIFIALVSAAGAGSYHMGLLNPWIDQLEQLLKKSLVEPVVIVPTPPPIQPSGIIQRVEQKVVEPPPVIELPPEPPETPYLKRAAELRAQLEYDLSVTAPLATIYLDLLAQYPDNNWAQVGMKDLQDFHLEKIALAFEATKLPTVRKHLNAVMNGIPAAQRDPQFSNYEAQLQLADRIRDLLLKANQYLRADALTTPAGANALESFRAVLAEQSDNKDARAGITLIVRRFERLARQQSSKGRYQQAYQYIDQGLSISPTDSALIALQKSIVATQTRLRKIQATLRKAEIAYAAGQLIEPEGLSAYDYYQSALKLDKGNQTASKGLTQIEAELRQYIRELIQEENFERATDEINTALVKFPNSGRLHDLSKLLSASQAAAIQASIEASRPKVTHLIMGGKAIESMNKSSTGSLKVDRTLYGRFKYINLPQGTSVIQAILYDGARSLQIAQAPVIVSNQEGETTFRIDRPVDGFAEGGYNIDLILNDRILTSQSFKVTGKNGR